MERKITKAYILEDGRIIKESDLPKAEKKSEQISYDKSFAGLYSAGKVIRPKVDFDKLVELLFSNSLHYRCIQQKVADVIGQGWYITSGSSERDEELKNQIEEVEKFFREPNLEESGQELFRKIWTDFETLGNAYFEIALDNDRPLGIWHIPAQTMRKCITEDFYVQIVNNKKKFFPKWKIDQEVIEERVRELGIKPGELSEHYVFSIHNFTPKDPNYGIPSYYPVISSILLDKYRTEYNISFFENNAVPAYAVVIEGGDLTEEVEKAIKEYFSSHVKGQANRTLVLANSSPEVKIRFEKLAVDVQEGSFRLLHQDDLYDIALAHNIPPRWLGIAEPGRLGGAQEGRSQAMNYKVNYVNPSQRFLAEKITSIIIHQGFGYKELRLHFMEMDLTNELADAKIGDIYLQRGVLSLNEFRKQYLNLPPIDSSYADKHIIFSRGEAIFLEDLDLEEKRRQEEEERKKEEIEAKLEEISLAREWMEKIANEFVKALERMEEKVEQLEKERAEREKNVITKLFEFFKGKRKRD